MVTPQPSRRQVLGGLLAAICGWLCPRKARAIAPLPKPVPVPNPLRYAQYSVTTYTYDAIDGSSSIVSEPGQGTTYVYDCSPITRSWWTSKQDWNV